VLEQERSRADFVGKPASELKRRVQMAVDETRQCDAIGCTQDFACLPLSGNGGRFADGREPAIADCDAGVADDSALTVYGDSPVDVQNEFVGFHGSDASSKASVLLLGAIFEFDLAGITAAGGRHGDQPIVLDVCAAFDANAVSAVGDSLQSGLDVAKLIDVTRNFREIYVDEQVSYGFLAPVRDLSGKVRIMLSVSLEQLAHDICAQLGGSSEQSVLGVLR
jgi:hypothetical protein